MVMDFGSGQGSSMYLPPYITVLKSTYDLRMKLSVSRFVPVKCKAEQGSQRRQGFSSLSDHVGEGREKSAVEPRL